MPRINWSQNKTSKYIGIALLALIAFVPLLMFISEILIAGIYINWIFIYAPFAFNIGVFAFPVSIIYCVIMLIRFRSLDWADWTIIIGMLIVFVFWYFLIKSWLGFDIIDESGFLPYR